MTEAERPAEALTSLEAGMPIVYGGDRVVRVGAELADAFRPGDRLIVVERTGDLLHIPAASSSAARTAVEDATRAFAAMGAVTDDQIDDFYKGFAARIDDDDTFAPILEANQADVADARRRGRSTTRLELTESMRSGMVEGLRKWASVPSTRGSVVERVEHTGWSVELVTAGLGVVGFVFEGRPNVFADATGVLRGGNTVVFRIGRDALGTARAIVEHALDPSLADAGLPAGSAALVDDPSHAAGWAMFADGRLALAVARGSGAAVEQLGGVAAQAGTPVSLHGTGGAWLIAGDDASAEDLAAAVRSSLDRKVCNTLNTCCIPRARAEDLVPVVIEAIEAAAEARSTNARLHVARGSESYIDSGEFDRRVSIERAEGTVEEPAAAPIDIEDLGTEWEWENSPEVSLVVTDDLDEAVDLFNRFSPRLVATLISPDRETHDRFFAMVDAPFVGNGFTRWVDGQYALGRPELGLSNWQHGRLLSRSGVLSGDSVYTLRTRATQTDPHLSR